MKTICIKKPAVILLSLLMCLSLLFSVGFTAKAETACKESGVHIDSFETGWNNGRQATGEGQFKEGTGSLELPGLGYDNVQKTLSAAIDIGDCDTLSFWLYVDNAAVFNSMADGQFELRPMEGGSDDNEIHWSLKNIPNLKNGWNYVTYNFADAVKTGSADFTSVGVIRFYFVGLTGADSIVVRFDDLHANRKAGTQLFNFESTVGGFSQIKSGDGEFKEGAGSLNMSGDGFVEGKALAAPVDISMYDGIAIWVFCGNASSVTQMNDFELEIIEDTGRNDNKEYSWAIKTAQLKVGWSRVVLKFADAKDKKADLTNIQGFGLVKPGVTNIHVYLDDLRAVETKFFVETTPPIDSKRVVSADKIVPGVFNGMTVDYADHKEGVACLSKDLSENTVLEAAVTVGKTSLSLEGDGMLGVSMWLYVSNVTNVSSVDFELSSSATRDTLELQWTLASLTNGWNWLVLSAEDAVKSGIIDTDAITRMTFDIKVNEAVTVKLDRISIINLSVADNLLQPPASEKISLNPVSSKIVQSLDASGDGVFDGSGIELTDHKQGKAALILSNGAMDGEKTYSSKLSVGKTDLMVKDTTPVNKFAFTFWLYVDDAAKVSKISAQVSSADQSATFGSASGLTVVSGWNFIVMTVTDSNAVVDGGFDADAISAFTLKVTPANNTDTVKIMIDRLAVANGAIAANIATPPASEKIVLNPISSKIIIDCDSVGTNMFQGNQIDRGDQRQGLGCVKTSGAGYGLEAKNFEVGKTDLVKSTLVFGMWIYIEDITYYAKESVNSQIELSSSSSYDQNELNWEKNQWFNDSLTNGWNWLVLYGKDANVSGGEPDYDNLSRFRIYVNNITASTLKLDRITLTNINDAAGIATPDWEKETSSSGDFIGPNGSLGNNDTFLETDIVGDSFIEIVKKGCGSSNSAQSAMVVTALAACFAAILKIKK